MHFRCNQGFFLKNVTNRFSKQTFPVSMGGSFRTIFGDCIVTILESWPWVLAIFLGRMFLQLAGWYDVDACCNWNLLLPCLNHNPLVTLLYSSNEPLNLIKCITYTYIPVYMYIQPLHNSHFEIALNYSHIPGIFSIQLHQTVCMSSLGSQDLRPLLKNSWVLTWSALPNYAMKNRWPMEVRWCDQVLQEVMMKIGGRCIKWWQFASWSLQNLILSMSFEFDFDVHFLCGCRGEMNIHHHDHECSYCTWSNAWARAEWRKETSRVISSRQQAVKGIRACQSVSLRDWERQQREVEFVPTFELMITERDCWLVVRVASNLRNLQLTYQSNDFFFGTLDFLLGFWQKLILATS